MAINQYLAHIANLVKSGYRTNAYAPYVWFFAVAASIQLIVIIVVPDIFIKRTMVITLVITIGFGMYMYYAIFKKDPKLLQSESFRLEDRKLDLISQKGSDIMIEPVNLTTPPNLINEGGINV